MKIYIICPVRNSSSSEQGEVARYVEKLESEGHDVFFPHRDVEQDDPTEGVMICTVEAKAMKKAEAVHIWWNSKSTGGHFDLGMAFVLKKPLVLVNAPQDSFGKSYLKVIKHIEKKGY